MSPEPRYCTWCGTAFRPRADGAVLSLPGSAQARRFVCDGCGRSTYRNPVVGVAVVLLRDGEILLGRRARGVGRGLWCIPCGYVEWDEDIRDAARREMQEETGLVVDVGAVCAVHSNFHDRDRQTVGVWFWGSVAGGRLVPGDDLDRVEYVPMAKPPPLAFPTDALVMDAVGRERGVP